MKEVPRITKSNLYRGKCRVMIAQNRNGKGFYIEDDDGFDKYFTPREAEEEMEKIDLKNKEEIV